MTYDLFEIVIVPFPFTDRAHNKRRPAVVCSSSKHFGQHSGHSMMAMITSAKNEPWPLDVKITDLDFAGLSADSVIRMKFFTLDHRCIIKKIGELSVLDQKLFAKNFKLLMSR